MLRFALALGALALVTGCGTPPPASQVPSAQAAIDRLRATQDCGGGIHTSGKVDLFAGKVGRIRTDLLAFAVFPNRLRLDIVSPFGVTLATLTSDGDRFAFNDLREKRFVHGKASACNIARLTTVPLPGHVLASLLRGDAPVLKHAESDATMTWEKSSGSYVVVLKGNNESVETLKLAPHRDDFAKPWAEQRLRLVDVELKQQGIVLYHADLDDHKPAPMDKPMVDPDGIDPPTPTSGPQCTADLPRTIHVEVPYRRADVVFHYENVTWNPPLQEGTFTQPIPGGVAVERAVCDD